MLIFNKMKIDGNKLAFQVMKMLENFKSDS